MKNRKKGFYTVFHTFFKDKGITMIEGVGPCTKWWSQQHKSTKKTHFSTTTTTTYYLLGIAGIIIWTFFLWESSSPLLEKKKTVNQTVNNSLPFGKCLLLTPYFTIAYCRYMCEKMPVIGSSFGCCQNIFSFSKWHTVWFLLLPTSSQIWRLEALTTVLYVFYNKLGLFLCYDDASSFDLAK